MNEVFEFIWRGGITHTLPTAKGKKHSAKKKALKSKRFQNG